MITLFAVPAGTEAVAQDEKGNLVFLKSIDHNVISDENFNPSSMRWDAINMAWTYSGINISIVL